MKDANPKSINYNTGGKLKCQTSNSVRVPTPSLGARILGAVTGRGGGRE